MKQTPEWIFPDHYKPYLINQYQTLFILYIVIIYNILLMFIKQHYSWVNVSLTKSAKYVADIMFKESECVVTRRRKLLDILPLFPFKTFWRATFISSTSLNFYSYVQPAHPRTHEQIFVILFVFHWKEESLIRTNSSQWLRFFLNKHQKGYFPTPPVLTASSLWPTCIYLT